MDIKATIFVMAVTSLVLVAAACDVRTRKLPNWLTVPGCLAGLVFNLVTGAFSGGFSGALHGGLYSLLGFATGFGILLALFCMGSGGAGDVKLMGALGAWLGYKHTLYVFFVSVFFVILLSFLFLVIQMCLKGSGYVKRRYLSRIDESKRPRNKEAAAEQERIWKQRRRVMAWGLPVALGTCVVLAWTHQFAGW